MTPQQKAYLRAASRLKSAEAGEAAALKAFQGSCSHDAVYETPMHDGYMTTFAPMRVCSTCGWSEEGWGCGYGLLDVPADPTRDRPDSLSRTSARACSSVEAGATASA